MKIIIKTYIMHEKSYKEYHFQKNILKICPIFIKKKKKKREGEATVTLLFFKLSQTCFCGLI